MSCCGKKRRALKKAAAPPPAAQPAIAVPAPPVELVPDPAHAIGPPRPT